MMMMLMLITMIVQQHARSNTHTESYVSRTPAGRLYLHGRFWVYCNYRVVQIKAYRPLYFRYQAVNRLY